MPNELTPVTANQQRFAAEYVRNGGNAVAAAIAAGYSEVSARQQGYALTSLPHVAALIRRELLRQLGGHAVNAVDVLSSIMLDEAMPPPSRVRAAIAILDRAGVTPPKRTEADEEGRKPLNKLSKEELATFIREAKAKLSADLNAMPVAAASAADDDQAIEIIDVDPT